jgi:hypothetical protein
MARGWDSKSIEQQQEESENRQEAHRTTAEEIHQAERKRRKASLELQRERILDEKTSNAGRRLALQSALADIEKAIAAVDAEGAKGKA